MAGHGSYEEQKRLVVYGLKLLGAITIIEVLIALLAKGHLIHGVHFTGALNYVYMALMVGFSLYKAYFIVYNFMHMASEVQGLRWSVLLPMLLLVWAVIAFFQEGASWGARRNQIEKMDQEEVKQKAATGSLNYDEATVQDLI
jgi:cytochrome c oxidase subunit IV